MSEPRVDSRWWYWVAAVPLLVAFWMVCSAWVAVVVHVVPDAAISANTDVLTLPAVALGAPAVVAFLVLPSALWLDSRAIDAAGVDWTANAARYAKVAAAVDAAVFGGSVLYFEGLDWLAVVADTFGFEDAANTLATSADGVAGLGALLAVVGVFAGTWLCVAYLWERRKHVSMPTSFWEWREELRPNDAPR